MVRFRLLKSKWRTKGKTVETQSPPRKTGDHGEYFETVTTKDYHDTHGQMMVSEYGLTREEKFNMEKKITGSHQTELQEKTWEKTATENLDEIRKLIDKDKLHIERVREKEDEKKEFSREGIQKTEELAPELIKGDIIDREIIYETAGGYVVKVTYKDNGQIESDYYSVSKIYDVEHALDNIHSYKPIIQEKKPEKKEQKDNDKEGFLKKSLGKLRI